MQLYYLQFKTILTIVLLTTQTYKTSYRKMERSPCISELCKDSKITPKSRFLCGLLPHTRAWFSLSPAIVGPFSYDLHKSCAST